MAFSSFNTLNQLTKTNKPKSTVVSGYNANILSTIQSTLTLQYYYTFDIAASGNTATTLTNEASSSIYAGQTTTLKNSGGTTQQIQTVITNNTSTVLRDPNYNVTNAGSFNVNGQYSAIVGKNDSSTTSVLTFPTGNNSNYTISLWFNISSCSSLSNFFGLNNNDQGVGSSILHLNIYNSGSNYNISMFDYNVSNFYPVTFSKPQTDINNKWHHVVYTVSISGSTWTATIYFNSVAESSITDLTARSMTHSAYGIGIGHRSDYKDSYINGYIDNFRIYTSTSSGALTQGSVNALYNAKA